MIGMERCHFHSEVPVAMVNVVECHMISIHTADIVSSRPRVSALVQNRLS